MSTGKGRIRASTENRGSRRVPEMWDSGEYWKCVIRACTGKVEIQVSTGKGGIRESIGDRVSGRVPGR